MKIKKSKNIILFSAITIIILYLIFAAFPLSKEYNFIPVWTLDLNNPVLNEEKTDAQKIFFKLGQTMGYFTDDCKLKVFSTFPSKATISSEYYATYSTENQHTDFYDKDGVLQGTINLKGFPYFQEDRIYNFLPGGSSFSMCNSRGSEKWTIESTIPITAFSSNKDYTAAGYADGSINVIQNSTGITEYEFAPGGSDYPVILGLDISNDGKYLACICGHEKQRFIIAENDGERIKIIYHKYLDSNTTKRTLVHICNDNNTVYSVIDGKINIFKINNKKSKNISITGKILDIQETESLIYLLGRNQREYTVYAIEKTNYPVGSFSFTAENAFITTYQNNLYVGKDFKISKLELVKE